MHEVLQGVTCTQEVVAIEMQLCVILARDQDTQGTNVTNYMDIYLC